MSSLHPESTRPSMYPTPTLASTLYQLERGRSRLQHNDNENDNDNNGEVKNGGVVPAKDYRTGIRCLDPQIGNDIFVAGSVVGVGGVGDLHIKSQSLMHNIISTYLLDIQSKHTSGITKNSKISIPAPPSNPSIYIIEPPSPQDGNSSLLHIYDLISSMLTRQQEARTKHLIPLNRNTDMMQSDTSETRTENGADLSARIDNLVSRISVLPYLDLIGVSQALSEVSDSIQRGYANTSTNTDVGADAIVLVRNLGVTLAQHAKGHGVLTQTFALLTEILRQMRRVARGGDRRVLVLLEVGAFVARREVGGGVELAPAFSSIDGRGLRLGLGEDRGGGENRRGGRSSFTVASADGLVGLLEEGVDGLVVVHNAFGVIDDRDDCGEGGKCIVEVLKDRMGCMLGTWAVWDG